MLNAAVEKWNTQKMKIGIFVPQYLQIKKGIMGKEKKIAATTKQIVIMLNAARVGNPRNEKICYLEKKSNLSQLRVLGFASQSRRSGTRKTDFSATPINSS